MSAEDREVSAWRLADTKQAKVKRRRWPDALKQELVAATMAPGASVSVIARRHDLNTNQLFKWCRQFGSPAASAEPAGIFSGGDRATAVGATFGSTTTVGLVAPVEPTLPHAAPPGSIEVVLRGGIRVKIAGAADTKTVAAVLGALMAKRRR